MFTFNEKRYNYNQKLPSKKIWYQEIIYFETKRLFLPLLIIDYNYSSNFHSFWGRWWIQSSLFRKLKKPWSKKIHQLHAIFDEQSQHHVLIIQQFIKINISSEHILPKKHYDIHVDRIAYLNLEGVLKNSFHFFNEIIAVKIFIYHNSTYNLQDSTIVRLTWAACRKKRQYNIREYAISTIAPSKGILRNLLNTRVDEIAYTLFEGVIQFPSFQDDLIQIQ